MLPSCSVYTVLQIPVSLTFTLIWEVCFRKLFVVLNLVCMSTAFENDDTDEYAVTLVTDTCSVRLVVYNNVQVIKCDYIYCSIGIYFNSGACCWCTQTSLY